MQVIRKSFDYTTVKRFYHLFISDLHIGGDSFDKKLFTEQMDEALELEASIYIIGDVMELIFPTDRKRHTAGSDKYHSDNELNLYIEEAYNLLLPYVNNIVFIGSGNHETSVQKYNNFDPIQTLVSWLNKDRDIKKRGYIEHGGYTGFMRLRYIQGTNKKLFDIWYHHGMSGAKRSRGILDFDIYYGQHDADAYIVGHNHAKFVETTGARTYLSIKSDELKVKDLYGVSLGCFNKKAVKHDASKHGNKLSFGEERMKHKQATGGVLMEHTICRDEIKTRFVL